MNRRKKLKSISIKSFVTSEVSKSNQADIAGGVHPECPTDGGPETLEAVAVCYEFNTTPNRTCPVIM